MVLAAYDFRLPPILDDDEIESVLDRIDGLISWASDIKEYALKSALQGKHWNGWKLVESRSNRRYKDEAKVIKAVIAAGYDPYERALRSVSEMEKTLGKSKFQELLSGLVEKPRGKPVFVPVNDKRPAIDIAKNDFMEVEHNG
jgi:hypothetical protein